MAESDTISSNNSAMFWWVVWGVNFVLTLLLLRDTMEEFFWLRGDTGT